MARHDRAYGVWFSTSQKGGNKRKGANRVLKGARKLTSKYAAKRDARTTES